jgi:3-oxoacyl-[acyl-carrier-protein] synthase II
VVITGLGVASPVGLGVEAFWEALLRQECGLRRIEAFDPTGFATQIGGALPDFSLSDLIPKTYRKSAKVMSRDIQIAVACSYHAVRDAGLNTPCIVGRGEASEVNVDAARFGANIGAGLVCPDLDELAGALTLAADDTGSFSLRLWGDEGMTNLTPLWLLKFLPNMLACHVTIVHDAQGPSNTITCGEASSHLAIGEAFRTIGRGDADVCVCGGAESKLNPMALCRPQLRGLLNTQCNDQPDRAVRPFASERNGTVAAEGGGLVILEALEHARARGARIYAELVGFASSNNAHHWSDPDPSGKDVALALATSLSDANLAPEGIDLVAPFGAGTKSHDASEIAGWNRVFGKRLDQVPALTTRGATGTCGAGSGAIDFAAAVMALHHNAVPASLNTAPGDPVSRFDFVHRDPIDAPIQAAISLGMSLAGGQRAALVIRRFEEKPS